MTPEQHAILQRLLTASNSDALFRPSSASGWMNCKGRIQLSAQVPRDTRRSMYADEGTAAHIVLNQALAGIRQPDEWTDRMVRIDDMRGWFVDEEMAESIDWCVEKVIELIGDDPDVEMFLEHRLSLGSLDPDDLLLAQNRGTGDVVLVNRPKHWLKIVDLKYGKGVMVAGDSPQLLDYAIMGLVTWNPMGGWESVESIVLQPRAAMENQRYKAVRFEPDYLLMDFLGRLVGAMEESLEPDPPLTTGDHCRWCPARPICPALRQEALAIAGDVHSTSMDVATVSSIMAPIPAMPDLPVPRSLSGEEIATILERRTIYDAWIKSVEEAASRLLDIGGHVPGWTLESRSGHRRFKDVDEATMVLTTVGGLKATDLLTEPKLKSPAQIEKIMSPSKKKILEPLVERPQGAPQLIRVSAAKVARADTTAALQAIPAEARA